MRTDELMKKPTHRSSLKPMGGNRTEDLKTNHSHAERIENENIEIHMLIRAVYLKYGHDLRHYSKAFLKRRFLRRLSLEGFNSISEMQHKILEDIHFFETLLFDLSIPVTEMFRDPSFYRVLREEIIPYLKTYPFIKIWHAGCATGEEVYSTAILLKEEGIIKRTHIYATDFNDNILKKAKAGIFPIDALKKYTSNYQKAGGIEEFSDYYTADSKNVKMDESLKTNITFANHNLVSDGVFNEMNLILCRNVLIYFDRNLKNRAIGLFHESLCQHGLLCLGEKENLNYTKYADCFTDMFKTHCIYRKTSREKTGTRNTAVADTDLNVSRSGFNSVLQYQAVIIGVSTGGLEALTRLISSLPHDYTLPIIIIQHQRAYSENLLVQVLADVCPVPVKEAEDKEKIENNVVYIAPADYHLLIEENRTFSISLDAPRNHARPSIDLSFETAADAYGPALIGIILTGAGNDGSRGLKRIKKCKGLAIVQDPDTAKAEAMPRSAIAATQPDHILPLEEIGEFLVDAAHQKKGSNAR